MSIIDTLIYDRTQEDLINETDKAYIAYTDLNRIEEAVQYLSNILNTYAYRNITNNKTNWNISELRKQEDCDRIKSNYEVLKNAYAYKFDVPDFKWESIEEANKIEEILFEVDKLIFNMEKVFRYSDTFYLGESEGLI